MRKRWGWLAAAQLILLGAAAHAAEAPCRFPDAPDAAAAAAAAPDWICAAADAGLPVLALVLPAEQVAKAGSDAELKPSIRDALHQAVLAKARAAALARLSAKAALSEVQVEQVGKLFSTNGTPGFLQDFDQAPPTIRTARSPSGALHVRADYDGHLPSALHAVLSDAVEADYRLWRSLSSESDPYLLAAEIAGVQPAARQRDCDVCPELVEVPGGIAAAIPAGLAAGLAVGRVEVTRAEWQALMGDAAAAKSAPDDCADCPVANISRDAAQDYLARLSKKTGRTYRLPSDAEWEALCRAGGAPCASTSWTATVPAGARRPNRLGLQGLDSGVLEWGDGCATERVESSGRVVCERARLKGGAADLKISLPPDQRTPRIGFRVVRDSGADRGRPPEPTAPRRLAAGESTCAYPVLPEFEAMTWICRPADEASPLAAVGWADRSTAGLQFMKDMAAAEARVAMVPKLLELARRRLADYLDRASSASPDLKRQLDEAVSAVVVVKRDAAGKPIQFRGQLTGSRMLSSMTVPDGSGIYVRVGVAPDNTSLNLRALFAETLQRDCALWQQLNSPLTAAQLTSAIVDPSAQRAPAAAGGVAGGGLKCGAGSSASIAPPAPTDQGRTS